MLRKAPSSFCCKLCRCADSETTYSELSSGASVSRSKFLENGIMMSGVSIPHSLDRERRLVPTAGLGCSATYPPPTGAPRVSSTPMRVSIRFIIGCALNNSCVSKQHSVSFKQICGYIYIWARDPLLSHDFNFCFFFSVPSHVIHTIPSSFPIGKMFLRLTIITAMFCILTSHCPWWICLLSFRMRGKYS